MQIWLKRAYEKPEKHDGVRLLVDRVWPRGVKKEDAQIDEWLKEVAPSTELRKWFRHDPDKWPEFKERYFRELDKKKEVVERLQRIASSGRVTLVYGAKDEHHNNAAALKTYLESKR